MFYRVVVSNHMLRLWTPNLVNVLSC